MHSTSRSSIHISAENEAAFTILIVGNNRVGKSSLIQRHFEQDYNAVYFPTNEIRRYVSYAKSYGKRVKLIVWDVNGDAIAASNNNNKHDLQKIYHLATQPQGIFFVYDICNERSFLDISKWISSMEGLFHTNMQRTLLGNKADSWKDRLVSQDMGQAMANLHQMRFFETSAASKTDTNIKSAFCMMIHDVRKEFDKDFALKFEIEEDHKKTKVSRRKRLSKYLNFKCLPVTCGCCRKTDNPMLRMDDLS